MTANFGCRESRTMASQSSVYDEERNRLRIQAWEQRNQETCQPEELNRENVPLFGEPYKTNKGDELSNRIQRMLGSYEDVNNQKASAPQPLPPSTYTKPDQGHPYIDKSVKPPFHDKIPHLSAQSQTVPTGYSSQAMRVSTIASSPNTQGDSSTLPKAYLKHSQLSQSPQVQKKGDTSSNLKEQGSLPQEISVQSPDTKSTPCLHSSDHDNTESKDTFNWKESTDYHSSTAMDDSSLNFKQSSKDASLSQTTKGNVQHSQTFPPLPSSKQPSLVIMAQKPTAYVRPMDGQDQVVSESPELKPSPEPYVPLQELMINKTDNSKTKISPEFLETSETLCVEDILREMTHSWPPLLTALHISSTEKNPALTKEERVHVSSCPGQKTYDNSSTNQSHPNQQSTSFSAEAAHSSGVESASTSDSESSSRSESDSESATEKLSQPPASSSKTEPDAPAVAHGDWQLGNWIRPSQQNSSNESQGGVNISDSPAHKQLQPHRRLKQSSVEVIDAIGNSKPHLFSHQKEFNRNSPTVQKGVESAHENNFEQSGQKSPSVAHSSCTTTRNLTGSTHYTKPGKKLCSDHTEAALCGRPAEAVATREKDPCFTDRPKVKMKSGCHKKSKASNKAKNNSERTLKHTSFDKLKAESDLGNEIPNTAPCPSCGVRCPNPCSCLSRSPAQPDQLFPMLPVKSSCSKSKTEGIYQKGTKMPLETHEHSQKTRHTGRGSQGPNRPLSSLLVKIDLRLLSRVPQASAIHNASCLNAETLTSVTEQKEMTISTSVKHKQPKASKKSVPKNVDGDDKTLPRKKRKLEKKNKSSASDSVKVECSRKQPDNQKQKKMKKNDAHLQKPPAVRHTNEDSKFPKRFSGEALKEDVKSKDPLKQRKTNGKERQRTATKKTASGAVTHRPLLKFEDKQFPVKHYIKEAKRLKHKADAESDKFLKAFYYLDAAMYFVESGIAMEKDPQISMSSYTMFSETVELLKFVLKLKNSADASTPPSEKDFLAICLKCQSLLQMAMFQHKQKTAVKYSKILTEYFSNSAQASQDPSGLALKGTPSPGPSVPSPAGTSISSKHNGMLVTGPAGHTVAIPQAIEQVAFTYINITTLFLSAHDLWEQAEMFAHSGSGILTELDTVMGPLSLTSSVSSMVRYTRQGVLWLRLDCPKVT